MMFLFFASYLSLLCLSLADDPPVVVSTSRGSIQGYHANLGTKQQNFFYGQADVFLGIPYVQPPLGNLRFSKPQRLDKFAGAQPLNATAFSPMCPWYIGVDISEDCLYLNVFSPNVSSSTKYPVYVWIHGGAFLLGGASLFDPPSIIRNFVSQGIVVVSIQYRLGILGFFTTGTAELPANLGLLDQVEALKFVKEEIANFGGDPNRITIGGESAGSIAVSAHTYSPLSRDLFQQAVMESGVVWTSIDNAEATNDTTLSRKHAKTLCNFTDEMWNAGYFQLLKNCMMKIDYKQFINLDNNNSYGYKIVVDGNFLPDYPENLYKTRPNKPILIGNNKDEFSDWVLGNNGKTYNYSTFSRQTFINELNSFFPDLARLQPNFTDILINLYAINYRDSNDHQFWVKSLINAATGGAFTAFTGREVDYYLLNGNKDVYLYEYTWQSAYESEAANYSGWLPSPHGAEQLYLFPGMVDALEIANKSGILTKTDVALVDIFANLWSNFIKYGSPSQDGSWPPTKTMRFKEYFEIGGSFNGMRQGFRQLDQYVWNELIPDLVGNWPIYNTKRCKIDGQACNKGGDCCSGFCFNGQCD